MIGKTCAEDEDEDHLRDNRLSKEQAQNLAPRKASPATARAILGLSIPSAHVALVHW